MSNYAFTFKKDDVFVDFSTTDREAVERQFQIWVNNASEYTKKYPAKAVKKVDLPLPEAEKPKVKEEEKNEEQPEEQPVEKNQEEVQPEEVEQKEESEVKSAEENIEEINEEAKNKDLTTINAMQNPQEQEETDDSNKFDEVLEKSIETSSFEPVKSKDPIFLNLINSKNTSDKFHYLIITAFYLAEFEKFERFSLKQINAKLMQNLSEVVDHTTLQEAINQDFIELVPDLTGTSEVGEYRLTSAGEDFFANKI